MPMCAAQVKTDLEDQLRTNETQRRALQQAIPQRIVKQERREFLQLVLHKHLQDLETMELELQLRARDSVVCACVNHLGLSKADFDFYVFQIRIRSPAFPPQRTVTHTVSHLCAIILSGAVRTLGHQQAAPPWQRVPCPSLCGRRGTASAR